MIDYELFDEPIGNDVFTHLLINHPIEGKLIAMPTLWSDWMKRYYDEHLKGCSVD